MRFKPEQYDAIIRRLAEGDKDTPANANMLVPWYLMAAYAYEELDDPFITDGGWDWLCSQLDQHWDVVEHVHKHLIDREALRSGTASYLVGALPNIITIASRQLMGAYRSPDEVRPQPKLAAIDDLLGIPATSLDDLL